jgi:hypothetical protein
LFFDANEFDGNVLGRNAEDGANFVIAQAFEPQQDDTSVSESERVDSLVEMLDLKGFLIIVLIGFDIHIEVHSLSSPLLLLVIIETEVEADAVDPRLDITFPLEGIKSLPESDQDLLKQVIHLVFIPGEHIADRIDCPLIFFNDS